MWVLGTKCGYPTAVVLLSPHSSPQICHNADEAVPLLLQVMKIPSTWSLKDWMDFYHSVNGLCTLLPITMFTVLLMWMKTMKLTYVEKSPDYVRENSMWYMLFKNDFLFYMHRCFSCIDVCIGVPWMGVKESSKLPWGNRALNSDHIEQPVFLIWAIFPEPLLFLFFWDTVSLHGYGHPGTQFVN